jgi:PPOX class probable F420-dependent enzyme
MDIADAQAFLRENHHAVMLTRRRNGDPAMSPVAAGLDDEGRVVVSTRETAMKVKHLTRDPHASLCVLNDQFFGQWIQIDGTAEIVHLPEAMELLVDYYRRISGEHPDWDDYRAAMERDRRVIVRITIERAGPDRQG